MTKQELREKSKYSGFLILRSRQDNWYFNNRPTVFREIEYFFDENWHEIGHIVFPNSQFESVYVFDTPRPWGEEFLKNNTAFAGYP